MAIGFAVEKYIAKTCKKLASVYIMLWLNIRCHKHRLTVPHHLNSHRYRRKNLRPLSKRVRHRSVQRRLCQLNLQLQILQEVIVLIFFLMQDTIVNHMIVCLDVSRREFKSCYNY